MYPSLSVTIYATLSSYNVVGASSFKERPHVFKMCWVIDLKHTHRLASWMTIISAFFEEVPTIFCFVQRHDIVIS